jgi:hypothetical protein
MPAGAGGMRQTHNVCDEHSDVATPMRVYR